VVEVLDEVVEVEEVVDGASEDEEVVDVVCVLVVLGAVEVEVDEVVELVLLVVVVGSEEELLEVDEAPLVTSLRRLVASAL
jgi:hypothetical protein